MRLRTVSLDGRRCFSLLKNVIAPLPERSKLVKYIVVPIHSIMRGLEIYSFTNPLHNATANMIVS